MRRLRARYLEGYLALFAALQILYLSILRFLEELLRMFRGNVGFRETLFEKHCFTLALNAFTIVRCTHAGTRKALKVRTLHRSRHGRMKSNSQLPVFQGTGPNIAVRKRSIARRMSARRQTSSCHQSNRTIPNSTSDQSTTNLVLSDSTITRYYII